jgi:hypothetical protein
MKAKIAPDSATPIGRSVSTTSKRNTKQSAATLVKHGELEVKRDGRWYPVITQLHSTGSLCFFEISQVGILNGGEKSS